MVTLALVAMFGIIGLAVDLGWSYYTKKTAQAAAEAAALAAARAAFLAGTEHGSFSCVAGELECTGTEPVPCPNSGNLKAATDYAAKNGFTCSATESVTVIAADRATIPPTVVGATPNPPGAPMPIYQAPTALGKDVFYWVTVRVSRRVPQLFSAILGHAFSNVAARATAAVANSDIIGSLILLNRQNEALSLPGAGRIVGTDLYLAGGPKVKVPGGIFLSSNTARAGWIMAGGAPYVESPITYVRSPGMVDPVPPNDQWRTTVKSRGDGSPFYDPMRTKHGQPPVTTEQLNNFAVPNNGVLDETVCPGMVCASGNYYAVDSNGVATGESIKVPSISNQMLKSNPEARWVFRNADFGNFHFFGGFEVSGTRLELGPGRYVMAGSSSTSTPVLNFDNNAWIVGGVDQDSDAGRIFILSDAQYPGLSAQQGLPTAVTSLGFGPASVKSGNTFGSHVQLFGLNPTDGNVEAAGLKDFAPVVIWQDQRNSPVLYENGNVKYDPAQIDTPYTSPIVSSTSGSPQLELWASQYAKYGGIIYQPRGAWTVIQANNDYEGAMQIISGAMVIKGNSRLTLTSPLHPITTPVAALIE